MKELAMPGPNGWIATRDRNGKRPRAQKILKVAEPLDTACPKGPSRSAHLVRAEGCEFDRGPNAQCTPDLSFTKEDTPAPGCECVTQSWLQKAASGIPTGGLLHSLCSRCCIFTEKQTHLWSEFPLWGPRETLKDLI